MVMNLENYFKNAKAYILPETFAFIKSKKPDPHAFATIQDDKEITVIVDLKKVKKKDVIQRENNWKVLTLDIVFPMNVCCVTAKIADCLAKAGVTIMPIAAYSRDHFLIKKPDVQKVIVALKGIGIKVDI